MPKITELIIEAVEKNDGDAKLQQIYSYVNDKLEEHGSFLKDHKHTVRGLLHRLVKNGILVHDPAQHRYKKDSQRIVPKSV